MKRLLLWMGLGFTIIQAFCNTGSIVAIPMPYKDLQEQYQERNEWLKSLSESGMQVLYYNQSYLIAALDNYLEYPSAQVLSSVDNEGLYLLKARNTEPDKNLPAGVNRLLDMDSCLLIQSSLPEQDIRHLVQGCLIPLRKEPISLESHRINLPEQLHTRNFITDMLGMVSQDSLMAYVQHLQNFGTRYAANTNRLNIANWLKNKLQSYGYGNTHLNPVPWQTDYQYNVIAELTGSVYPDSYVIVGAHYDSQNWTDDPMLIAPGADDNATGVAAILEIARIMKAVNYQPRCSILFISLAAEEIGCIGTYNYVANAQQNNMDIRLMINMDMIGNTIPYPDDQRMLLHSYDGCLDHAAYATQISALYTGLNAVLAPLNEFNTDSYLFWEYGFPAISFDEFWMSPVYHSTLDTVDYLDPVYFSKMAKNVLAMAAHYSHLSSPPAQLEVTDTGTGNSLRISWDASNDPLVNHYVVHWGESEWNYSYSAETTAMEFVINGLTEGTTCYIGVSAADPTGLESYQTTTSGVPLHIPRIPTGFTDLPQPNAIELLWAANQELDLAAYHIYRSLSETDPGSLVGIVAAPQTSYLDAQLPGLQSYYCYRLCAVDSDGNQGLFTNVIKSRPVSLDQGILIIDETMNYTGTNPFQPTDTMVDDFYNRITTGLQVSDAIDLEETGTYLRLADLGIYSSIIWHGNDFSNYIPPFDSKAALKDYINYGGQVLFSICHPGQAFELDAVYPASFAEDTFINQVLGIQGINYTNAARFRYAISQMGTLNSLQVDSLKTPIAFHNHIFHVEGLEPTTDADPLFCYGSDYDPTAAQGYLNGMYVGIRHVYGEGKAVLLSFPLYFMREDEAQGLIRTVLIDWFGEPVSVEDELAPSHPGVILYPPHPNPFQECVSFKLDKVDTRAPLKLEIFNLKGQLIRSMNFLPQHQQLDLSWNGEDFKGHEAGSGVYFVRVSQGQQSTVGKVIYLK